MSRSGVHGKAFGGSRFANDARSIYEADAIKVFGPPYRSIRLLMFTGEASAKFSGVRTDGWGTKIRRLHRTEARDLFWFCLSKRDETVTRLPVGDVLNTRSSCASGMIASVNFFFLLKRRVDAASRLFSVALLRI